MSHRQKVKALLALIHRTSRPNKAAIEELAANVRLIDLNIKAFGYSLARVFTAALPVRTDTTAISIGLRSKISTQADIESEWAAHWAAQLKTPVIYHRKLWEYAYVLQAIHEHGFLVPGTRALGFGCGVEPTPSYLASQGLSVTVTDLEFEDAEKKGWVRSKQHLQALESAFHSHLVDRASFDRLVDTRAVDMNHIPRDLQGYDCCWSMCALEHLGSLEAGLDFIENALGTIRPGGLAVHTTEFNTEEHGPTLDHSSTVLFQRKHLEEIASRLRAKGHDVAELDFDLGDGVMDRFIDMPPWAHDMPDLAKMVGDPLHLKLGIRGFVATCFGIVIRKAA